MRIIPFWPYFQMKPYFSRLAFIETELTDGAEPLLNLKVSKVLCDFDEYLFGY